MSKPIDNTQVTIELPDRFMRVSVSSNGIVTVKERTKDDASYRDVGSGWEVEHRRNHPAVCWGGSKLECVCGLGEQSEWHPSFPMRIQRTDTIVALPRRF